MTTMHPRRTAVPSPATVGLQAARPASAAPGMQPLRECGCPEWVEMCVHFDGRWVALHLAPPFYKFWAVCQGVEPPAYLESEAGHNLKGEFGWLEQDEQAALAVFRDAEARLLGMQQG